MSKPLVYNYKTAEERIERLKKLVLYMGESIAKVSAERDRYKGVADRSVEEALKLRHENNELRVINNQYRIRLRIEEGNK